VEATLLVEVLTEELPPKALQLLGETFKDRLLNGLIQYQLKQRVPAGTRYFATPRRLAVIVPEVNSEAQDRETEIQGPLANAPSQAIAGFAKKHGVGVERLERRATPKGDVVVARIGIKGAVLAKVLPHIVEEALKALPSPKLMRWGAGEAQFVRPVHGLLMMHGQHVVPGSVLGVQSRNRTRGHRFMGRADVALSNAEEYEAKLRDEGGVIADFAARRAEIARQLAEAAERERAVLVENAELLDEVTALVELPSVYVGRFDPRYLEVPQECLILTMRQNQKYFPLFDAGGRLLPRFLIVSNMRVADPRHIVAGNERVVRPRLEDARFFYEQDRKRRLEERVPQLARVVYHHKLGSQLERVERIQLLAGRIAEALGAERLLAERAAWLAKADLLTAMVGEFPELQGIMGRYYALHDGEAAQVAEAIEAHYRPRHAGDRLPEGSLACAVALADKLDTLAALFSAGERATGDKDPFGLRRAALGLVRIVVERRLPLPLRELIERARAPFDARIGPEIETFIYERLHGYLRERGFSALQVEAVLAKRPCRLDLVPSQLDAVRSFQSLPEAESLAAANKRIRNILRKSDAAEAALEESLLQAPEERRLYESLRAAEPRVRGLIETGEFAASLKETATLRPCVDSFFDNVLVNAEDARLRANRHALLRQLESLMNQFADISRLAQ
jgi:glycyl-tRNA synthetase beta chain